MLLTLTVVDQYPSSAQSYFAGYDTDVGGAETEGGEATYTPNTSRLLYAVNEGNAIPPQGTRVIASGVGGRLAFRYDG